jgi:predicted NAD/FAD-dependent oxidoreductase
LNLSPEQISDLLINELERHLEQSLNIKHSYAHRWLYSCVAQGIQAREGYLWDEQGIGLIGDYINTEFEGVESAWLSGKQLAEWITLNNTVVHS